MCPTSHLPSGACAQGQRRPFSPFAPLKIEDRLLLAWWWSTLSPRVFRIRHIGVRHHQDEQRIIQRSEVEDGLEMIPEGDGEELEEEKEERGLDGAGLACRKFKYAFQIQKES